MRSPGALAHRRKRRLSILLVEDRPDDVALVRRTLEKCGYEITLTVADTEDAYVSGLAAHPDIILSDYHLPKFSGERALELAHVMAPKLPFIVLSGSLGEEACADIIKRGANDCLLKASLARLPAAIESAVAKRQIIKLTIE